MASERLADVIRDEIKSAGPMPFARFMQLALYHPGLGYYEREDRSPGKAGDYFTSVSVGPVFGELLGAQFTEWWRQSGSAGPWSILEAGAHDGRLAADILRWLREWRTRHYEPLVYWILEPSRRRQAVQATALAEFAAAGKVKWVNAWDEVPTGGVRGVIFANELLDAFPVHRAGWDARQGTWFEWGVDWDGRAWTWVRLGPLTAEPAAGLAALPSPLRAFLPDGYVTETCPTAAAWWKAAAQRLGWGRLMTLDYGLETEEYLAPEREGGTLRGYQRHRWVEQVLDEPGERDLTAHVNFTALRAAGEAEGLRTERMVSQEAFLSTLVAAIERAPGTFPAWTGTRVAQLRTLVHPAQMGRKFRVLVQTRETQGEHAAGR